MMLGFGPNIKNVATYWSTVINSQLATTKMNQGQPQSRAFLKHVNCLLHHHVNLIYQV
jgi:hypothetical protein